MKASITISGSFQKALNEIRADIRAFESLGCSVLSPRMFHSHKNEDGFVILDSDGDRRPAAIHGRHLTSIDQSILLWVRNPGGYVGLSTALEIGHAHAIGVPVYASDSSTDSSLNRYIRVVSSPEQALQMTRSLKPQGTRSAKTNDETQADVAYMSVECGFDKETDQEILSFLDEEITELKEAVAEKRDNPDEGHSIAEELADCGIYLYHFANQSGINLQNAIQRKININLKRWGRKRGAA